MHDKDDRGKKYRLCCCRTKPGGAELSMRLTLVIPSLQRGGAERVMCNLANAWAEQGREVTLLTLNKEGPPAFRLHPSVKRYPLDLPSEPANFLVTGFRHFARIRALRRAFRELQPDVIISFIVYANILTLLAAGPLKLPVIVSERADPRLYKIGFLWGVLRRLTYQWADMLVCQTQSSLEWFQKRYKVPACAIPNPVALPAGAEPLPQGRPTRSGNILIAVGRLSYEKGFDLLLNAFARVADRHPAWTLKILGDGPCSPDLVTQCRQLNLTDRVDFPGAISDPFPCLRSADLFVLPSRFEGFPNALCEAMAAGLPPISFDCPSGPAEIIRDGIDGILVPPQDVDALASALDSLMGDSARRKQLAIRAPEVLSRFSPSNILLLWEEVFEIVFTGTQDSREYEQRRYRHEKRAKAD
jgi:GalNAc-alpha-(1->4)-GalNAc-alpha-(1->3)-diNAcBac-PP-undecaprenol alpha-1,4-N-acetyl-D-galactosaminyltransferase